MQENNVRAVSALLGLVLFASLGACNCNNSSSTASSRDQNTKEAEAQAPEGAEERGSESESSGKAPPADLYPGMNFGELDAEDRRTFVSVAEAELCPCPEANSSLHECLQSSDAACATAKRSATIIARGVKAGVSEEDILSRVAKFLKQARKEYEFDLERAPRKGPKDAPVRIVEFADFQCPHCKRASAMLKSVVGTFEGEVAHYFKHFPLESHGSTARMAARAAVAAQNQEKFWPMHDLLFENQRSLSKEKIVGFARRLGMNVEKFKRDMQAQGAASAVQKDRKEGLEANISGTPAIFINGSRYMGDLKKEELIRTIEAELGSGTGDAGSSSGDSG